MLPVLTIGSRLTDEMLSKGIAFQPRGPRAPVLGNPGLLVASTVVGVAENNLAIEVGVARENGPKLAKIIS